MPLPKAKREETYGAFFSFFKLWYRYPLHGLSVPPLIRPETSFREIGFLSEPYYNSCDLEMYWMSGQANSDLSYVGCPLLLVQS